MTEENTVQWQADALGMPGEWLHHWVSTCPLIESQRVVGTQVTIFIRDTKLTVASWMIAPDVHPSDIDASLLVHGWSRARPWEAGSAHGLVSWVSVCS